MSVKPCSKVIAVAGFVMAMLADAVVAQQPNQSADQYSSTEMQRVLNQSGKAVADAMQAAGAAIQTAEAAALAGAAEIAPAGPALVAPTAPGESLECVEEDIEGGKKSPECEEEEDNQ